MGALLAAMGVALIFIGALIETLDLTVAALASFFCIFAIIPKVLLVFFLGFSHLL